jgi:acyl dehydratase
MSSVNVVQQGKDIQNSLISDEALDKVNKLIGVWLRRDIHAPSVAEPLSLQDIRRWAIYSVGDDNPLYADSEYGKRSIYGSNIAPPTFLYTIDSGIVAPGLAGVQWIFAGGTWELFKPVKVGDAITARARLLRVELKEGKRVPRFVNQVGEVLHYNQNDELVARYESNIFRIPRARTGAGFKFDASERPTDKPYRYSDQEIEEIAHAYRTEERRGKEPRYWEDVTVGDVLPTVLKGPLTLVDIVGFYAGRRQVYNVLKLAFAERDRHPGNVYYSPSINYPVHPAAGHFDLEIAKEVGMPGAYDQGWQRMNWGGHLLTNWIGDHGFVRRFSGRVIMPNLVGDLTKLNGKVVAKTKENGEALVEVEWTGTNQYGKKNCDGNALLRLPSRDVTLRC